MNIPVYYDAIMNDDQIVVDEYMNMLCYLSVFIILVVCVSSVCFFSLFVVDYGLSSL